MPLPKPPDHLRPSGRQFWIDVLKLYHLEAPDLARLELACDALDVIALARDKLAANGLDRVALNAWRDASKLFLSALRQMGVDLQQTASGRLPALASPKRAS